MATQTMTAASNEALPQAGEATASPPYIGAAYYPPFGDRAAIARDAQLMRAAGFNVVRLGDLTWDTFEPAPGDIRLAPLVEAVEQLAEHGIVSIVATPTAAIPRWLCQQHPDALHVRANGARKPYGRRRHACLNHAGYNA